MRSIWSGTVSFGMVTIPVKLLPAVSGDETTLHRVRRSDGSRIRMRRVAEADGEDAREVPWDDTVMGYETGSGTTVLVEDADFALAYGEGKDRAAQITAFVPLGSLPRMAAEASYWVQPDKGGDKAYELLATALLRSGKAAVVSIAVRQRKANAMLYATDDGYLVLERLQWAAAVNAPGFAAPKTGVTEEQVEQAQNLIGLTTAAFSWDAAQDSSGQRLAEVIQAKIEAGDVTGTPSAPGTGAPANLEDVLRASVEAARAAQAPAPRTRGGSRTRRTAAA